MCGTLLHEHGLLLTVPKESVVNVQGHGTAQLVFLLE